MDGEDSAMADNDASGEAFQLAVEALREVSLDGYLTVDVASLRALQIFQACRCCHACMPACVAR